MVFLFEVSVMGNNNSRINKDKLAESCTRGLMLNKVELKQNTCSPAQLDY